MTSTAVPAGLPVASTADVPLAVPKCGGGGPSGPELLAISILTSKLQYCSYSTIGRPGKVPGCGRCLQEPACTQNGMRQQHMCQKHGRSYGLQAGRQMHTCCMQVLLLQQYHKVFVPSCCHYKYESTAEITNTHT